MGQPIVVVEKPSVANPGMVRFETNRALTGMGHERYVPGEIRGDRPPDELARRLFARGGIEAVHVNGSVVTVDLAKGQTSAGLREIIEGLYIHYPSTDAPAEPEGDVPDDEGELRATIAEAAPAAPAPEHVPDQPATEAAAEELAAAEAAATPEPEASGADAVAAPDETSNADVQADEGDAPTLDQSPVGDPGGAPPDAPGEAADGDAAAAGEAPTAEAGPPPATTGSDTDADTYGGGSAGNAAARVPGTDADDADVPDSRNPESSDAPES